MKAIVTVVGKDQVGIIAGVCNTLADCQINVLDISQFRNRAGSTFARKAKNL